MPENAYHNAQASLHPGGPTLRKLLALLAALFATPYAAMATLTDPLQDDAGTGGDAGDDPTHATRIREGEMTGLLVAFDDPDDVYKFTTPAEAGVSVYLGKLDIRLADDPTCALEAPTGLGPILAVLVSPDNDVVAVEVPCGGAAELELASRAPGAWLFMLTWQNPGANGGLPLGHASTFTHPGGAVSASTQTLDPMQDYTLMLGCEPYC